MWIKYVIIGSIIISLIILISRRVYKSRVLSYSPNIFLANFADIKLFNIKSIHLSVITSAITLIALLFVVSNI